MHRIKRLFAGITLTIIIAISGCSGNARDFDAFTEQLFFAFVSSPMEANFLVKDAEAHGFAELAVEPLSFSEEECRTYYRKLKEVRAELQGFNYRRLDDSRRLTYRVVADYLDSLLAFEDFLYYERPLGSFLGYQARLPLLLSEYHFYTRRDIENYFAYLEATKESFKNIIAFEKKKAALGFGMSDWMIEGIIRQCRDFLSEKECFLIPVFETKLEEVVFLSLDEKRLLEKEHRRLIEKNFLPAYRWLVKELENLKGKAENGMGLAHFEQGKEYYQALFRKASGTLMEVPEAYRYLEEKLELGMEKLRRLLRARPELVFELGTLQIFPDSGYQEIHVFLRDASARDFPEIGEVDVRIEDIHESLAENSSPAMYFLSPIDAEVEEVIYVNGKLFRERPAYAFFTLAHEGIPGHLLQHAVLKNGSLPKVRKILDYPAYSEGWATYVETYVGKYLESDQDLIALYHLNDELTYTVLCLGDIGINYFGWTLSEFQNFLGTYFTLTEAEGEDLYRRLIEIPANYLEYYFGYHQLLDLKEEFLKKAEKQGLNDSHFHKFYLETGPAPFYILREEIDRYLADRTKRSVFLLTKSGRLFLIYWRRSIMKRFVLLVLILAFPVAVSGKTIVTTENLLDDWALEEENLILSGENVDWTEEGVYHADYYDPGIRTEIRRDVIVTNREVLKKGLSFFTEKWTADLPGVRANGFLPLSDGDFFIYGNVWTGEAPYQTQDEYVFAYLAYFEKGLKSWERIFDSGHYGSFTDACLTENGIALIGQKDREGQGKNIVIYEVARDGEILFHKEFFGSRDDHGIKIAYHKGKFHFLAVTMSDDIDFRYSEDRDIFLGRLDRDQTADFYPLNFEGRDEALDAAFSDGNFYIAAKFDADGSGDLKLVTFDKFMAPKTFDLDSYGKNSAFRVKEKDGKIMVSFRKDGNKLMTVTLDKSFKPFSEVSFEVTSLLLDYEVLSGFETYYALLTASSPNANFQIATNEGIVFEKRIAGLEEVVGISQDPEGNILVCLGMEGGVAVHSFQHFRIKENRKETEEALFTETEVTLNGKTLKKAHHSDDIPENPFGRYQVLNRFEGGGFVFYLADERYYRARTNIRNGEVYDLGVRVFFNGEGYINNRKVETGVQIDEPGHFLLEIRSEEESHALVFEVRELSESEEAEKSWEAIVIGDVGVKGTSEKKAGVTEVARQQAQERENFLVPAIIVGLLLGIVSALVIGKVTGRKKHA